jgi:hypothetical protein
MPLRPFVDNYIIDDRHLTSLLAPYSDQFVETALLDWLGLGHGYEQMPDESMDLTGLESSMSEMDINDDEKEKEKTETEEKTDDKDEQNDGEEKVDDKKQENAEEEINEEEEEEQRRRDELDLDEDSIVPSVVRKPQTTTSNTTNEPIIAEDGDGEGEWQVKRKKPYDRRRLIRYILQYPTTLTDQAVSQIKDDVWDLPNVERYDLYRYWLLKYQQYLHHSGSEARRDYNQAAAALAEYHQEEDYYILKDSVIVAMTTTCAAKYHTVLEKLRKRKNKFLDLKEIIYF